MLFCEGWECMFISLQPFFTHALMFIFYSVVDGSSGGFLNDAWMLRLANYSTDGMRYAQQRHLDQHCRWRTGQSAVHSLTLEGTESCVRGGHNAPCELRNLLLLPWCDQNNQTVI